MMWVGIATAIMLGSGAGDDFGALQEMLEVMEAAVLEVVDDPGREAEALIALDQTARAAVIAKDAAKDIGACLDRADRDYTATREDYQACARAYDGALTRVGEAYVGARARFEAAVPREDWPEINRVVAARLAAR